MAVCKNCAENLQKRKKKIPAQCVCAGKIKWVLSGNNFGIAFDEFLSLAVADRDLIAGREDNCIIFNVMDILGVYKEALMAQDKSVTFKLLGYVCTGDGGMLQRKLLHPGKAHGLRSYL